MDTGVIVALGALFVSAMGLLLTARKETRGSAEETAQIKTKLDSIASGVDEIRVEMRSIRERVSARQIGVVEASNAPCLSCGVELVDTASDVQKS